MMRSAVGIAAVVLALDCVTAMDNGLALRPPLGWSTWQTCGDEVHGILDHPSLSPLYFPPVLPPATSDLLGQKVCTLCNVAR